MAGVNKGAVFTETYGTTSPVSGSAPTAETSGQPLDGLFSIELVVSAAAGATLSGAGTLDAYIYDPSLADPNGSALANGGSGVINSAFLAYDGQSGNFGLGLTVTGGTSGATGVIAADTDAGTSGVLSLTSVVGVFQDNEAITDSATGAAAVNGVAYKTLAYDTTATAFEVGQVVTGSSSGAVGTVSALTSSVLTFPLSTVTGVFVDNEVLAGVTPPRWVRLPSADVTVTATTRDQAFNPFIVDVPRKSRIKWVPTGVTFGGGGSGGITVHQLGQTNTQLHDAGRWGG